MIFLVVYKISWLRSKELFTSGLINFLNAFLNHIYMFKMTKHWYARFTSKRFQRVCSKLSCLSVPKIENEQLGLQVQQSKAKI